MKSLILLLTLAWTAVAADISGTWKGTAETPNGTIERTFVFKADGNKLTGTTTSQMMGESKITDGKIDGDNVSFTINVKFQDNDMKLNYNGKVVGNEIKFKVDGVQGNQIEYTAKKVS